MKKTCVLLLCAGVLSASREARGGLQVIEVVDTSEYMRVVWGWDPEEQDQDNLEMEHWDAGAMIEDLAGNLWSFVWAARHKTDPHFPIDDGGGDIASDGIVFDDGPQDYGRFYEKWLDVDHHPTGIHWDEYYCEFDRSYASENTRITLEGRHCVPEPGTLFLLALGVPAMIRRRP